MLQTIDDHEVFVVEFSGWPVDLPITWETEEERPYAIALDSAIKAGIVTAAGKYGIHVTENGDRLTYNIFAIKE